MCGGQIDTQLIMHAFTRGFEGVALLICAEGCCHNVVGNVDLERRLNLFKEILKSRGIDENHLRVISTCSTKDKEIIHKLKRFYKEIDGQAPDAPSTQSIVADKDECTVVYSRAPKPIPEG